MVDLRLRKRRAVEPDGSFARRTRQDVRTHPIKTRRDVCPAALVLDQKKLVAFSVVAGRFLLFPIGDRRCNRTFGVAAELAAAVSQHAQELDTARSSIRPICRARTTYRSIAGDRARRSI